MKKRIISAGLAFLIGASLQAQSENFTIIKNNKGADLGYSPESGIKILTVDGKKFKDLNKNGKLDKYEDWRLSADERAKDLASKMSVEQIAGLMLYSRHQALPAGISGFMAGTYSGKPFPESNAKAYDLTDQQKAFLKEDNLRHVLITSVESPETAALWNNRMQAFVEGIGLGIPSNTSTDPRHNAVVTAEFNAGAGGTISMWPDGLGMAATFDPKIVEQFGQIAAKEYRALGIATALSPQIDLGSEPRWYRISMTFGESPALTRDMGRAYIDGFQTSYGKDEIKDGWGYKSVNAMVKHWPSGGAEEGGRDGHWAYGKFAVYPGNNLQQHIDPFVNGAFKLKGKTGKASAVMPYYTISFDQDKKYNENVANGYSKYIITDLLRDKYGYDGVVCTDWLITADEGKTPNVFAGKPWGVENLSIAERHYKAIIAGVDQFGGNNDKKPVLEAYDMGVKEYGESFMRARFERSAVRLLKNIFRVGLFENPYLNVAETKEIVGNPEFMKAGYDAQLKSVVLLKNKTSLLPVKEKKTVFIPKIYTASTKDWWGIPSQPKLDYPVNLELVKKYYNVTEDPTKADFAIVFVTSPQSLEGGYDLKDRQNGSNGYVPISLQYGTYTATEARTKSIAAGDQVIDPMIKDRTYKNKTVTVANTMDLRTILDTKDMMNGKPVIVSVTASKPMIFNEFEKEVDGIVLNFGVSTQAVLDIISGKTEPSGLLPVQMPANMETVEKQFEDVPYDMIPHKDSEGNVYDFAYGLNWKGVIKDTRTETYKKQ
ncbi:beta-glucosidase [Flavobacterium sp. 9]|uniref:glycoside hydrolase family 3 protein n=1 Tax=Flavobacterium sp. 9 TaxID=2035198 RepID=UPI000C17E92C|nr:glycoside hydrolase family 3 N-terminal domain-containing protein [Flavobacterium sp. 9]PIF29996.1 beta-glucosidase [Flavobacterium sp. 9]